LAAGETNGQFFCSEPVGAELRKRAVGVNVVAVKIRVARCGEQLLPSVHGVDVEGGGHGVKFLVKHNMILRGHVIGLKIAKKADGR
jgi:hypothetical protein